MILQPIFQMYFRISAVWVDKTGLYQTCDQHTTKKPKELKEKVNICGCLVLSARFPIDVMRQNYVDPHKSQTHESNVSVMFMAIQPLTKLHEEQAISE